MSSATSSITAFKVRSCQRTRTLRNGGRHVHKYYIVDYCQDGVWHELPRPYSDVAQARRAGRDLIRGTESRSDDRG